MSKKIRVVVTEDSFVAQKLLVKILESDPDIEVVGVAGNGKESVRMVQELKPDLVTMDIRMPVMNGFQATQHIMSESPTPILVISSSINNEDLKISFNAIQAGALDIMEKPRGSLQSDYREIGQEVIRRVKMMAEIKVFRHLSPRLGRGPMERVRGGVGERAVAIGASTGGPRALLRLLQDAPENLPAAVFITQHISEGFGSGCVDWLNKSSRLTVKVAEGGEIVKPGVVYFAPDRGLLEVNGRGRVDIREQKVSRGGNSIDIMMTSVASVYKERTIGVLLTGMGSDGVEGLRDIKEAGGKTIVQDEETSMVFGMPRAAVEKGVADNVLPLDEVLPEVVKLLVAQGERA